MTYPNNCVRGIPNDSFLLNTGFAGAHLFDFKTNPKRNDGLDELSINWEDDNTVIDFSLHQLKEDGEFQFRAGVAVIPREEIARLNSIPAIRGLISYERKPEDGNPFHGNILIPTGTPKPTIRLISAGLALAISSIISQKS